MRNSMQYRDSVPADRFMDVWYLDAVTKPMEVARTVYPFIGMTLTPEIEARMEAWMGASRRDRRAAHEYSMEKMGLTQEQLEQDFADYRQRYILARQA
jgi:hypothetical protein